MTEVGIAIANSGNVIMLVLGAVLGLSSLWLAVQGNAIAPLLVMASVPIQRVVEIGTSGNALTVTQGVLAGFFAGALLRFLQERLALRVDAVFALSGALGAIYAFSVVVAPVTGAWAGETYRWLVSIAFLWLARPYFAGLRPLFMLVLCSMLACGSFIWAIVQIGLDDGPASFSRNGVQRAYGAFGEPNPFAAFISAATLPCVAFALFAVRSSRTERLVAGVSALAGMVALILTQSRGALLGMLAGLGLLAAIWVVSRVQFGTILVVTGATVVVALLIVAIVGLSPWSAEDSDVTTANWANHEREAHWMAAVSMIEEHPVLGVGAGGFDNEFRNATTNWHFRISRGHAHNAYLQVASEAGVLAVVIYICLLGAILAGIWRRTGFDSCDWLRWGVIALTIAMLTHQLFDYLHVLSLGLLYAGFWAAALSVRTDEEHLEHHRRV